MASLLVVRAVALALGVAIQSALARTLLPADRGIYAMVATVTMFLCLACTGSVHHGAQYEVLNKNVSPSQGASASLAAALAGSTLAVLLALPVVLSGAVSGFGRSTLLLALAIMPAIAFNGTATALLPAFWRYHAAGLVEAMVAAAQVVGTLALVGWLGLGVEGALAAFVGCQVAGGVVAWEVLRRRCGVRLEAPSREALRRVCQYGRRIHLANLGFFMEPRVGILVLWFLASREETGLFAATSVLLMGVYLLPVAFTWAVLPRITGVQESRPDLAALAMRVVGLLTAAGFLALTILREPFARIVLGEEFLAVAGLVPILAPGLVAASMSLIAVSYLKARGRPELPSCAALLQMAAMVGLALALYPGMGLQGAAGALSLSLALRFAFLSWFFCRLSGAAWTSLWRVRRTDMALLAQAAGDVLPWRLARKPV